MKQHTVGIILICLSGVIVCVLLHTWYLKSYNDSQGYWEAEIGNAGPHASLTLRLKGGEAQPWHRVIVFQNIEAEALQPGRFKLPDEADQMPGARMTFEDITLRPGRVTFEWQRHEIGLMMSGITVDGEVYRWDKQEPIRIPD
tara:strand:- start:14629 stop:15057 length:429 start_codon:yes stop_codon:yes gene_type:complete